MQKPTRLKQVFTSVNIFLYLQERTFSHMKRLMIKNIFLYNQLQAVALSQPALIMPSRPSKHMVLLKVVI